MNSIETGNSFSRDAANKAAMARHRQKMPTISVMISNILNMMDSQPVRKKKSSKISKNTMSVFYLNHAKIIQKLKSHFEKRGELLDFNWLN
jgi:hypothetical protein